MKRLLLVLSLFLFTSCIGPQLTPEDNSKKSKPRCCIGQDEHTCGMRGMTGKPAER